MINTFDIMLNYYDTPQLLRNWLHRVIHFSDFKKFAKRSKIIIADSGTPIDKLDESLSVVEEAFKSVPYNYAYLRLESDEIRKSVPERFDARMQVYAYNMVILDYSTADMIIVNNVGNIVSPDYFNGHVIEHVKSDRAVVLPKRYDLFSDTYHTEGYKLPWSEVVKGDLHPSGGWPDLSVRRQWYVEIGGWDEWFKFVSPFDMDLGSRLTGKLDNGQPSEWLIQFIGYDDDQMKTLSFKSLGHYNNLGLDFVQPENPTFISLTCNSYSGHGDFVFVDPKSKFAGMRVGKRKEAYDWGYKYYIKNWGKIKRNAHRIPSKFDVILRSSNANI